MSAIKHIEGITEPIDQDTLWGGDTRWHAAEQWPFADLLANFYKLAQRNLIEWPLKYKQQWSNIELVRSAMKKVYYQLPPTDQGFIAEAYAWFLEMDKIIDWQNFGDYQEPEFSVSGRKIIEEQEDLSS